MWANEELPIFITIVAREKAVLAYGHCGTLPEAVAWSARGMGLADAEQVVITKTALAHWIVLGEAPVLVPVGGWVREHQRWRVAQNDELNGDWDELCAGPHTLEPMSVDALAAVLPPRGFADWRSALMSASGVLRTLAMVAGPGQTASRSARRRGVRRAWKGTL